MLNLEYHIYDTSSLIKKGKLRGFLMQCEKFAMQPSTDLYETQLQMQLCRRLLFCYCKLLAKNMNTFAQKQMQIQEYLRIALDLCQFIINLFNKYEVLSNKEYPICERRQLFKQEKINNFKTFQKVFETVPIGKKSQNWFISQQKSIFGYIQKLLNYRYLYARLLRVKDGIVFLNRSIHLKGFDNSSHQNYIYAQLLANSVLFETNQTIIGNHLFDQMSYLLIQSVKEYQKQPSIQQISQIKNYTSFTIIYLFILSLYQEFQNNYIDSLRSLQFADYLSNTILSVIRKLPELKQFIKQEYQQKLEKYEQYVAESHDIQKFVIFIYGMKEKEIEITPRMTLPEKFQKDLYHKMAYNTKNQYIIYTNKQQFQPPVHMKSQSVYSTNNYKMDTTAIKDNTTGYMTKDQSSINNRESLSKEVTPRKDNFTSFTSQVQSVRSKRSAQSFKKPSNKSNQPSYLSQLIKLRHLSQYDYDDQEVKENEIDKNIRLLSQRLDKLKSNHPFQSVDKIFKDKIESIALEKCLTLDQVKNTAKKIIAAEWEVHKEMPVTQQLMKSISVSQLRNEPVQLFNKLREYFDLERTDYYNYYKDQAQFSIKETKDYKQMQMNSEEFQQRLLKMKMKKQKDSAHEKLLLLSEGAGISPKFIDKSIYRPQSKQNTGIDQIDRKNSEFKQTKQQLTEMMVQNLEDKDNLIAEDFKQKQIVLPRQYTQRITSPRIRLSKNRQSVEQNALANSSCNQLYQI